MAGVQGDTQIGILCRSRRCCMKTRDGWVCLARISCDPPQEPHLWPLPVHWQRPVLFLQRSVQFGSVSMANKSSIVSDLHGWRRRLYLERNCRLPEGPAHSRRRNREGPASSKGLNSQRGFGPAVEPRRKSRLRSTSQVRSARPQHLAVGPAAAEQALH